MPKSQAGSERSRGDEQEDLRPGSPPRPSTQPKGSGASNVSSKTRTDPNTGAPNPKRGDQR